MPNRKWEYSPKLSASLFFILDSALVLEGAAAFISIPSALCFARRQPSIPRFGFLFLLRESVEVWFWKSDWRITGSIDKGTSAREIAAEGRRTDGILNLNLVLNLMTMTRVFKYPFFLFGDFCRFRFDNLGLGIDGKGMKRGRKWKLGIPKYLRSFGGGKGMKRKAGEWK